MILKTSAKREEAASLVAFDKLTDQQIAERVGVKRLTIWRWKRDPDFLARVGAMVEDARAKIVAEGIANKQNRIDALNDRWRRMQQVIAERADDDDYAEVPGGKTGLLAHQVKMIGTGERAQRIDEYAVDTGLLKEMREHEKQAAVEVGQWTEKTEASGGMRIVVEYADVEIGPAPASPGAA